MKNGLLQLLAALAASLVLHGVLAALLALYLSSASAPETLAQLDLSSIDLSFAETPDEQAQAASLPSAPSAAHAPSVPPPSPAEFAPPPAVVPSAPAVEPERRVEAVLPDLPETRATMEPPQPPPAPSVAPQQARVEAPARPQRSIRPEYPRAARQRGEQGSVLVEIDVSAGGGVDAVRLVRSSGYVLLDEAAIKAVRAARFTPARAAGRSVPSTARLTLDFRLK